MKYLTQKNTPIWNIFLLPFFFILSYSSLTAQDVSSNSPYDCIYNHLNYLQDDNYQPSLAGNSFPKSIDSIKRRKLAIKLKQIYDGKGLFIRLEVIPDSAEYYDSTRQEKSYYPFPLELPSFYVVRTAEGWYYSKETVSAIPAMHSSIYPFGSDYLMDLMPNKTSSKFLGLMAWQYLGLGLMVVLAVVLFLLLLFVFRLVYRSREKKNYKTWRAIKTLTAGWLSLLVIKTLMPVLLLPVKTMEYFLVVLSIITSVLILLILLKLINIALSYLEDITSRTASKMDDQLLPLVRRSIQFVVIGLWLLNFLSLLGVNITTLIAGVSIGGLALALAAQDTLKNLFGSIMIFLDKPFQIGDWVISSEVEGTVEEVGFRSTRIRSFANSLIYVPNSKLADSTIDNQGLRQFRRYKMMIGLTYNTPPDKIDTFVKGLRQIVENHPKTKKDGFEIHLNNLGASALEILFYIFLDVADWTEELKTRHSLLMSILHLAEDLGVSFAFPSTSVYLEKE